MYALRKEIGSRRDSVRKMPACKGISDEPVDSEGGQEGKNRKREERGREGG